MKTTRKDKKGVSDREEGQTEGRAIENALLAILCAGSGLDRLTSVAYV